MDSSVSLPLASNGTVHAFVLDGSRVGLSITLLSHAASLVSKPLYREGDLVAGTVHLDVRRGKAVKSIVMTLQGRHGVSGSATRFMNVTTRPWPPPSHSSNYTGVSGERNLRGASVHPFRFHFPSYCVGKDGAKVSLPPTFQAPLLWVDYELRCTVSTGKFAVDEVLTIPIQYRPNTMTRPTSSYRLQAYETGMPIPGPDIDPAGWRTATTSFQGGFFSQRQVEITCWFSLAEPLEFPRGYPIPFVADISCTDAQLVDVMAAQSEVLSATLIRHVGGGFAPDDVGDVPANTRSWITHRGTGQIHLAGEIPAPASLPPSFRFSGTAVQYYVRYAVQAPGLQLRSQAADVPIVICTTPAPGPAPVSYTGPPIENTSAISRETDFWAQTEKSGMLACYVSGLPGARQW